jgi:hypothetical protein
MPLRGEVTNALRYLKTHPQVSEYGIKHIAGKLSEEGEPEEVQKYLRSAYSWLRKSGQSRSAPMVRNIMRLHRQVGGN